jgi:hypothetical protein
MEGGQIPSSEKSQFDLEKDEAGRIESVCCAYKFVKYKGL